MVLKLSVAIKQHFNRKPPLLSIQCKNLHKNPIHKQKQNINNKKQIRKKPFRHNTDKKPINVLYIKLRQKKEH